MNNFNQDCKIFHYIQALIHTPSNSSLSLCHVTIFSEECIIMHIVKQFFLTCHLPHPHPPLMSKYSSTHPVLEKLQSIFSFSYEKTSFTSFQNTKSNYRFVLRWVDKFCLHCNISIYIRHIWIKPVLCSRMVSLFHHTSP